MLTSAPLSCLHYTSAPNRACTLAEIFYQASVDPFHTYSVSMSYIQIYMELIQDLLNPQGENLVGFLFSGMASSGWSQA